MKISRFLWVSSLYDNFSSGTLRVHVLFCMYISIKNIVLICRFQNPESHLFLNTWAALPDLYSTWALANSCHLHKRYDLPILLQSPPLSILLMAAFLICVPAPRVGIQASSLCVLQTFISHCLLDVPWVPQTQHIMTELTSSSPVPQTSSPPVFPVLNDESQPIQSPKAKAWASLGLLSLPHPTNDSSTTLTVLQTCPLPEPSHRHPWLGPQEPCDWSSCLHSCPSNLLSPLQPKRSLKCNMIMSLPA